MEYVAGESLSRLVRKTREAGRLVPPRYAIGIIAGALDGLHAAHEATSEKGQPLGLVHRDVSPQNIHVGIDGVPRVLDFGIAKATNRVQETRTDQIKGKVAYMSPEQLAKGNIDRRADVYSASVVLWEALTGQRLFKADDVPALVYSIINDEIVPPSAIVSGLPSGIDEIVMRGLSREADQRWPTALAMAEALEKVIPPAPTREIGAWVEATAGDALAWRQELVHRIESETASSIPPPMHRDSPAPLEVASGVHQATIETPYEVRGESIPDDERATVVAESERRPPPEESAAPARSSIGIVAVVVAVVLVLGFGALFVIRVMQMNADAVTSPGAEPSAPPSDSASEPAIVIGGAQRTAPTGAAATAGVTTTSTTSSAKPTAIAPARTATAPPPPPHDECEVPFVVDSRGIRHPKPQCFKR
jgi:serine/threonine-protein kinase